MVLNVSFSVDHTQILLSYNQSLVIIPEPFREKKKKMSFAKWRPLNCLLIGDSGGNDPNCLQMFV